MPDDNKKSDTAPAVSLSFIEQLQMVCEQKCENPRTPYLSGHDVENEQLILMKPACKMWSCRTCAARNAKRWIARVINGVNRLDGDWFMFTLTAHEKWRGTEASVKNLRQGWKKLYNRMRATYGTSAYVKVWEMHQDGSFHLHGLIDTQITQRWLKRNARACGLGYQVEIHLVDNAGQVAGYISKYFLKSEGVLKDGQIWPKNLRRIEVSRNWPKLQKSAVLSDLSWLLFSTRDGQLFHAEFMKRQGIKIIDTVGD